MRLRPVGEDSLLVDLDTPQEAQAWHARILEGRGSGTLVPVRDIVPGDRTVLLYGVTDVRAMEAELRRWTVPPSAAGSGPLVEIPVYYDGADLGTVAGLWGVTEDEVARIHSGTEHTVAFCGFAPGFAYMLGLGQEYRVPRRSAPRTSVPAGSVALAGPYTGVYPRASPGGWQLIGTTQVRLWDPEREPAALLTPGTRVRFVPQEVSPEDVSGANDSSAPTDPSALTDPFAPADSSPSTEPSAPADSSASTNPFAPKSSAPAESASEDSSAPEDASRAGVFFRGSDERAHGMNGGTLDVVRAGALTTVQDLGRSGHAGLGVPRAGALDRPAHLLANRLVGNPADAATLETTLTGVAVRTDRSAVAAVTGAPAPVRVNGRPAAWGTAVRLPPGAVLDVGAPTSGLRSYVAIDGGVAVAPVLGSRSTDLLSGLGPAALRDGGTLPLGEPTGEPLHADAPLWEAPPVELVLPLLLGPRDDWFTTAAVNTLAGGRYEISQHSNRIALRLEGPFLERAVHHEMPSEGMVVGAVQVPPDGRPVVFLGDCPTTGGYPVIGVVPENRLYPAAQAVPGLTVRFVPRRHRR